MQKNPLKQFGKDASKKNKPEDLPILKNQQLSGKKQGL
jgi:hypothetical protein